MYLTSTARGQRCLSPSFFVVSREDQIQRRQECLCYTRMVKTAPPLAPFAALTEPPFCSTIDCTTYNPSPEIIDLVETRGWKILGRSSGEIPGPSSLTTISTPRALIRIFLAPA